MEKRSRRRIRDLVAPAAFQGLSQNEIGCARISMMARSTNAPFKGRIQKRKTNHLQIITFGLQRTAGPYKGARSGHPSSPEAFRLNSAIGSAIGLSTTLADFIHAVAFRRFVFCSTGIAVVVVERLVRRWRGVRLAGSAGAVDH